MADFDTIKQFAHVTESEADLLAGADAPIVLLAPTAKRLPDEVAPGISWKGWMLPYTPLHCVLVNLFGGPLVMTSGNVSDEPQIVDNEEALAALEGIADSFLLHDRDIARRHVEPVADGAHQPGRLLHRIARQVRRPDIGFIRAFIRIEKYRAGTAGDKRTCR